MAKAKKAALERVHVVRTHWSQVFADMGIGCGEIPIYAARAKTPEEAWDKAPIEHLQEIMGYFDLSVKAAYDDNGFLKDDAADIIRKKYPTPPRKMMVALGRWLKKKPGVVGQPSGSPRAYLP